MADVDADADARSRSRSHQRANASSPASAEAVSVACSGPTIGESSVAVAKAVAARRARHRGDPGQAGLTVCAIAERVTGITLPPRPGRDGWWRVGRVLDELADTEFSVWFMPGAGRIGISERPRPVVAAPVVPMNIPYYYDGLRRKWIDALTGEVIAGPDTTSPGGYESRPRDAT